LKNEPSVSLPFYLFLYFSYRWVFRWMSCLWSLWSALLDFPTCYPSIRINFFGVFLLDFSNLWSNFVCWAFEWGLDIYDIRSSEGDWKLPQVWWNCLEKEERYMDYLEIIPPLPRCIFTTKVSLEHLFTSNLTHPSFLLRSIKNLLKIPKI
jgi:hypothetical protein